MPTITEQPVKAYAHCRNPRCSGYQQQEVDALVVETSYTGRDLGDNSGHPFASVVERSVITYRFAGEQAEAEEASKCPGCGVGREVTGRPRPGYRNVSGHDPHYLVGGPKFDPTVKNTEADEQLAAQAAEIAALKADMKALLDALKEGAE